MDKRKSFQLVPPVAFPVRWSDAASGILAASNPEAARANFSHALAEQLGVDQVHLVSSGRSALSMILMSLPDYKPGGKVIIPAYGCSTILQSVLAAGLNPVFCDVSLDTLDYDRSALDRLLTKDIFAVVGVHLYGMVNDYSALITQLAEKQIAFVEDSAQSFGAAIGSQAAGTQGQVGFYSLGRGKCLPTGGGGVIVSRGKLGNHLNQQISQRINPAGRGLSHLVQLAGYAAVVNPIGWRLIERSQFNPASAGSDFDQLPEIQHRKLSAARAGIGHALLKRAAGVFNIWRENAAKLDQLLRDYPFVRIPEVPEQAQPVYLRFPIVLDSEARTERLWHRLSQAGISASRSYRFTLPGMFGAAPESMASEFPSARHLSNSLLTLPTNHYLDDRSLQTINQVFQSESSQQWREANAR